MNTDSSWPAPQLPFERAVVLGAGLMGRLLALQLARAGCQVDLYEAGGPQAEGAAARVAAAMLAPLAESAVAPPSVVRMGHHGLERWPQLIAQLPAPVFFQREGTLVLWHRQDAAEAQRLARRLDATQKAVPELPAMQHLTAHELALLEPALGQRFAQAYLLPGEGQLDNRALLAALLQALQLQPRVRLHWHSAKGLNDFNPAKGEQLIDCRGLGAQAQWPALRGVRGELIRVHAPDVQLTRPTRLIHPRYPLYIAPKPEQLFVIGATEIESEDMSPLSVRSALELLSAAYAVHSGFAEARIVEMSAHCRPALPHNRPAIRCPRSRVMQINGLYRHGFMIAPAVLDAALQLLAGQPSQWAEHFEIDIVNMEAPA